MEADKTGPSAARRGPPNRMNDLVYRDWMKFQKSFFWSQGSQPLVEECIYFFTKAMWEDEQPSRSLIAGCEEFDASKVTKPRMVDVVRGLRSAHECVEGLVDRAKVGTKYDFVLVDLRPYIRDRKELQTFLQTQASATFGATRQLLNHHRYCAFLVPTEGPGGAGFPMPWAFAVAGRDYLRLRDEKIGLVKEEGRVFYCLFMQADDDKRPGGHLVPGSIRLAKPEMPIPAWIIPKPPPRKKHEVLHPAKYPETLVAELIETFTKPNQTVFDPMVGTGSTVIAAMRTNRHGYGVDLSPEFVSIATKRIAAENPALLFEELQVKTAAKVFQGDATVLADVPGLDGIQCHYVITSPPYWSMLANPGSENQEARRKKNLRLVYSGDTDDLGNVADYDAFLNLLEKVYKDTAEKLLLPHGYLTVVVKNVKRDHVVYPLAWDLVARLCAKEGVYEYVGNTLWCQDDVGLKPFAVGIHWVSNTLHHYCLHFRRRQAKRLKTLTTDARTP